MKSQTSFYNKAYIISNLKRHGYLGLLFFVLSAAVSNLGIIGNLTANYNPTDQYSMLNTMFATPWDIFLVFVVPVILGIVLFRYIMEEKALSAVHAMPVSRRSLFFSQLITFKLIYGLPIVLNGFIAVLILIGKGYPVGVAFGHVFLGVIGLIVAGSAVFGVTFMFGMLVGSSLLQAALTYILMGAPFVIVELTRILISWTLKGFPDGRNEQALHLYLTPYYSLVTMFMKDGQNAVNPYYALAAVVVLLAATYVFGYFFYQKRALEAHTELIAFKYAKKVFVIILTVMITLSLSTLIGSLMGDDTTGAYMGLVIGALFGYAITKMIAEKTVAVLKYWKQAILVTVAFVTVLAIADFDLIGYEDRVPDTEDIASVFIGENVNLQKTTESAMTQAMTGYNDFGGLFHEEQTIDLIKALHEALIAEEVNQYTQWSNVTLVYVLENGKKVHRTYRQELDPVYIKAIHESEEYKDITMDRLDALMLDNRGVEATIRYGNMPSEPVIIRPEDYMSFLRAYRADFNRMSYNEERMRHSAASIEISILDEVKVSGDSRSEQRKYYNFNIWPSFKETNRWLEIHGMGSFLPELSQISSVRIAGYRSDFIPYDYNVYSEDRIIESKSSYFNSGGQEILDKELIEALYELGYDYTRMHDHYYILAFNLVGGGYYEVRIVDLPEEFMPYVSEW